MGRRKRQLDVPGAGCTTERERARGRERGRERVSEGARRKFIGGESRDGRTECRGWSRGAGLAEVDVEEEE